MKEYPDFVEVCGYGQGAGICGWNCRHSFYPYFIGDSNPFEQYDEETNKKSYGISQEARRREREIRALKRKLIALQAALDSDHCDIKSETGMKLQLRHDVTAQKLLKRIDEYTKYCKDNKIKPQYDRQIVYGFDSKQGSRAKKGAKRADTIYGK